MSRLSEITSESEEIGVAVAFYFEMTEVVLENTSRVIVELYVNIELRAGNNGAVALGREVLTNRTRARKVESLL